MILDIMAIKLTQDLYALVDGENYEWLNQQNWYALKNEKTFYAVRSVGKQQKILMHREILGLNPGDGIKTDHTNYCGLDNRIANIRICTNEQNNQNQRPRRGGTSQYKGVYWSKIAKKWEAQIRHNNKAIYLGLFDDELEAAKTYDKAARELFGEFAKTNF